MKSKRSKFAGWVLVMAMILAGSGSLWAQDDTDAMTDSQPDAKAQTRLTARVNTVINGIRSELRGIYPAAASPIRLNAELEQLNLPIRNAGLDFLPVAGWS